MALRLQGASSGYIELKAPASAGDNTLTLPTNNGSANTFLKTDGSGNLSWQSNLTFDGTKLDITTTGAGFRITRNSQYIELDGNSGNGGDQSIATSAGFRVQTGGVGNSYERLRITSGGNVHINGVPPWTVTGGDWRNLSISGQTASSSGFLWLGNGAAATNADFDLARINICNGATIVAQIAGSTQTGANDDGRLTFSTKKTTGSLDERIRITSSGALLVGTTTPNNASGDIQHEIKKNNNRAYTAQLMTSHSHLLLNNSDTTDKAFTGLGFRAGSGDGSIGYVYRNSANNADFVINTDGNANGIERLRVFNGGSVLIGSLANEAAGGASSTGSARLIIDCEGLNVFDDAADAVHYGLIFANDPTTNKANGIGFFNDGGTACGGYIVHQDKGSNNIGDLVFGTSQTADTPTERFRITSTGVLKSGAATLFGNAGVELSSADSKLSISRASSACMLWNRTTSAGELVDIRYAWTGCGSISVDVNSTTYATSSDYRLKENVVEISDGITRLKTLKPSRFNWIGHAESTRDGFIAHEVTAVPEAITGTKDACYTEDDASLNIKTGDPKYQQIDQAKLVPLITAALKEAIAKIETLETKVAALESA